jgi:hypothetical protein
MQDGDPVVYYTHGGIMGQPTNRTYTASLKLQGSLCARVMRVFVPEGSKLTRGGANVWRGTSAYVFFT